MTKILKRPLSILLAVLMVMSVFIAVPMTASAAPANYLTFTAEQDGSSVTLKYASGTLQYNKNNSGWESYTAGTQINLASAGNSVRFRGKDTTFNDSNHVSLTGKVACSGSVMSLRVDDNGKSQGLAQFCFDSMFSGCTGLTSAPELPETTLAAGCYYDMFYGCSSLTTAPALPATTLAVGCYYEMFYGCWSLTTAPALPATTLAPYCYYNMFNFCSSLTTAPEELPATTLAQQCYFCMFLGCTSLTTAPALPATTLAKQCYYAMFSGCESMTTAPELPATTLAESCYSVMFADCESLTTAPALPATTLAKECYYSMFYGCGSLTTAPELPATTLADGCYSAMFEDCTSLTTAPALPATTLVSECYYDMFYGCSGIKLSATQTAEYSIPYSVPSGGNGTDASDALYDMFVGTGGTFTGTPEINKTYYVPAPAPETSSPSFVKVTSAPDDWSGEYLLVYEVHGGPNEVFNSAANLVSGANTLQAEFGVSDGNIDYDDTTAAAVVTIAKIGDTDCYSIKTANDVYIGKTDNNNGINTNADTALSNTIEWDTDCVKITSSGGPIMRYNTGSSQFRYYKSSSYTNQQPIQLYKLTAAEPAPATHTHSFTYAAGTGDNANKITATCGEGCDITEGLTLTISAPTGDLTADGTTTFPATLSTGYNTTAFPGTYTIAYTKDGQPYDGTPTEAGAYTASVTVGTATASVSYTVAAPAPEGINYGDDNYIKQDDKVTVSGSDEGKTKFELNLDEYLNMQMLGIQKKSAIATQGGDDGIRFVTAVNTNLLKGEKIEDYGYIVVKAKDGTSVDKIYENMDKLTYDKVGANNRFTCKGTSNTISGDFGKYDTNTDYKYVTLSLTGTSSSTDTIAARFYIKTTDGNYYYADYIDGNNVTHRGMAFTLPIA